MAHTNTISSRKIQHIERTKRVKLYTWVSGSCIILATLFYAVFYSPLFTLKEFIVESSRPIQTEQLIETLKLQVASTKWGGVFGPDHYLSWSNDLHYSAPEFSDITIEKKLLSKSITIRTIARDRFVVWCNADVAATIPCLWVDSYGIAHEPALESTGQLIFTVFEKVGGLMISPGSRVLSEESFMHAQNVLRGLSTLRVPVRYISVDRTKDELIVETHAGAQLQFSLRFNPEPAALPALKKIIHSPGLWGLQYVNLTVENRAFYKSR